MKTRDDKGRYVRVPMESRFWEYVDRSGGDDACWLWTGNVSNVGYGRFTDYWKKYSAHRLSYEFANGPIPPGLNVCHTCDVRRCVNPRHLWLGSHRDNVRDAATKGRLRAGTRTPARGEANPRVKLTNAQVREIRAAYEPGRQGWPGRNPPKRMSVRALAEQYGVASSLIHRIVTRKVWTHLD